MKCRRTPALTKSVKFLKDFLQEHQGKRSIPSLRDLAEGADVSVRTMQQAVQICIQGGILSRGSNHRLTDPLGSHEMRGLSPDSDTPRPLRSHGVERVYTLLFQKIEQGIIPPGHPFPPSKQIAFDLGADTRTIAKAFIRLQNQGLVIRDRRLFRVTPHTTISSIGTLVLMGAGNEQGQLVTSQMRGNEEIRLFEGECIRRGFKFQTVAFVIHNQSLFFHGRKIDSLLRFAEENNVKAFILYTYGLVSHLVDAILIRTNGITVPVAVLDETGYFDSNRISTPRVRSYVMAQGTFPGEEVGSFLLGLGHRTVAYFSYYSKDAWSINRFQGLKNNMSGAGTVFHFSVEKDLLNEQELAAYTRKLVELNENRNDGNGGDQYRSILAHVAGEHFYLLLNSARWKLIYDKLAPFFGHALENKHITAWVCENDFMAISALRFLNEHAIAVPQRISIVGFDNSPEATHYQLTSYSFNPQAYMRAMLDDIIDERRLKSAGRTCTEIRGMIFERGTTAAAPKVV